MAETGSSACPVDAAARDEWLRTAASQSDSTSPASPNFLPSVPSARSSSDEPHAVSTPYGTTLARPRFSKTRTLQLSHERQTSSIPRFLLQGESDSLAQTDGRHVSPNSQSDKPTVSDQGNWVYPSESQFYDALVRKHGVAKAPSQETMHNIVPIHNAVNERTWEEILHWERRVAASVTPRSEGLGDRSDCVEDTFSNPQLVSFRGDSQKLTPRARFKSLLGYQAPFDRHDWIVRRRTGEEIEYVIDFYSGKNSRHSGQAMPLSFYLDVRPKLNSLEGCRMRVMSFWGLA
ncbi:MAG: hypothetical protein Q9159_002190 [Coniocarpon cinnabarinum]